MTEDMFGIPEVSFVDQVETGVEDHFETVELPVSVVHEATHESKVMVEAHEAKEIVEAHEAKEMTAVVDVAQMSRRLKFDV
ncbi:hypothetical protein Nepgr_011705 [Nepenthes gracilis]|uniref:Uncharacterized protein n=1 Tax=Nepenthes gracilis TaxID=150966 RepID=A0AAD3SFB0_NEPGR|nr:hypothetical protein Nepgr_011705 [Nepenthes gracilis]